MQNCENKEWQVHGGKYEHIFQQLITAIALLTNDCLVYMTRCYILLCFKNQNTGNVKQTGLSVSGALIQCCVKRRRHTIQTYTFARGRLRDAPRWLSVSSMAIIQGLRNAHQPGRNTPVGFSTADLIVNSQNRYAVCFVFLLMCMVAMAVQAMCKYGCRFLWMRLEFPLSVLFRHSLKIAKNFVMSVLPSAWNSVPLDGYSWNLIFECFFENMSRKWKGH
jgi:hypothetical protein